MALSAAALAGRNDAVRRPFRRTAGRAAVPAPLPGEKPDGAAIIEDESLQFFPLAVCTYADEDFSSWQFCVWIWEALAALGILAALLVLLVRRRKQKNSLEDGRIAGIFLTVLSGSQIFLEQLRDDDALRFGFVISFT